MTAFKSDSNTLEELRISVFRFSVIEFRNVSAENALSDKMGTALVQIMIGSTRSDRA